MNLILKLILIAVTILPLGEKSKLLASNQSQFQATKRHRTGATEDNRVQARARLQSKGRPSTVARVIGPGVDPRCRGALRLLRKCLLKEKHVLSPEERRERGLLRLTVLAFGSDELVVRNLDVDKTKKLFDLRALIRKHSLITLSKNSEFDLHVGAFNGKRVPLNGFRTVGEPGGPTWPPGGMCKLILVQHPVKQIQVLQELGLLQGEEVPDQLTQLWLEKQVNWQDDRGRIKRVTMSNDHPSFVKKMECTEGHCREKFKLSSNVRYLTHLTILSLVGTRWGNSQMPSELGLLDQLVELHLCDMPLRGPIPKTICRLPKLQVLNLHNNCLENMPTELGSLKTLQMLDISCNGIQASIPTELGQLTQLRHLALGSNTLADVIPTELGQLTALILLDIRQAALKGSIPTELGNLLELQELKLCFNRLTGAIPTELGQLNVAKVFWLHRNLLTGQIPTELINASKLSELDLSSNQLNGPIPSGIGQLQKLTRLDLCGNQLTSQIPSEIGQLLLLFDVSFDSNKFTGALPTEMGNLINLEKFGAGRNQLNGTIPTQIGNCRKLTKLDLQVNNLSGPIPTELGYLENLDTADLSSNKLEGTIPKELGRLTKIRVLDLHSNTLTGQIPKELGGLKLVIASKNQLIGAILVNMGQFLETCCL